MKRWLLTSVAMAALSTSFAVHAADPLHTRSMAAACANCHGTHGVAQKGMDSLAGKPKDELLSKMLDFKTGKKPATIMHQLSKGYSDEQLEELATYFSNLKR